MIVREYELGTEVYVWAAFTEPEAEKGEEEQPAEEQPTEEQPAEEQSTEEQPTEEEPTEEQPTEEEPVEEEPTEEESTEEEPTEEEPTEEEPTEEEPTEEQPTEEEPTKEPVANALVYTGEAQALVSAGEGWLFSLDGETYAPDIPTAVDAGEYTVYFVPANAEGEVQTLIATVAKADVVLIPPEAMKGEA